MKIICPNCKYELQIAVEKAEIFTTHSCPICDSLFEIAWLYPLTTLEIDEQTAPAQNSSREL